MLTAERYTPQAEGEWNALVAASANGTFLTDRRYMDYHSDRFTDCSLLFRRRSRVVAALPACVAHGVVTCHAGLTYGPLVVARGEGFSTVRQCIETAVETFRASGAKTLRYKPIPYIYTQGCQDEDLYTLFRMGARLTARGLSSAIDLDDRLPIIESRKCGVRKALRADLTTRRSDDVEGFWQILDGVLTSRHDTKPVHSADEMRLLMARFPHNIRLYTVHRPDGTMVGGTWVFVTQRVAHTQYMAASDEGRAVGALDLLLSRLLETEFGGLRWLDFGISTEDGGRVLNEGLLWQKEGFGGRGVCYDLYELEL